MNSTELTNMKKTEAAILKEMADRFSVPGKLFRLRPMPKNAKNEAEEVMHAVGIVPGRRWAVPRGYTSSYTCCDGATGKSIKNSDEQTKYQMSDITVRVKPQEDVCMFLKVIKPKPSSMEADDLWYTVLFLCNNHILKTNACSWALDFEPLLLLSSPQQIND